MIYESYPWKQDLLQRKNLFVRFNTVEHFEKNEEATYTILEKAIFYSAFIIRKLLDCRVKLSDDADTYNLNVERIKAKKTLDIYHRWPKLDTHDWENSEQFLTNGKNVCNWLIHSYLFSFVYDETGIVSGFLVASDYDKNKLLYSIHIGDWIDYMTYIGNDSVVAIDIHHDMKKEDYIATRKERG